MDAYCLSVGDILHDLGASVSIHDELQLDEVLFDNILFVFDGPVQVDAVVTNTGAGLVASGTAIATLRTECVRCLEPFSFSVHATLEAFFTTSDRAGSLSEDQEWELLRGDTVDLLPAVHAAIRIELPIAPLHDPNCAGICPLCGCDRNESECSCDSGQRVGSPFDVLRSLLSDTNGRSTG